nr:ribonuclease H-like domain, reverse transcriptase, RNA-dependent DNA polymerase [Tanacetum cinerariifolium]
PDVEIDYSKFIYGPKQTSADESDSKPVEYDSSDSDSSVVTTTSMPATIDNAPKIVYEPQVFSWVYFLKSKDETRPILKDFIRQAENQFNHKVKTIRSDNGTEFKNRDLTEFYGSKGIKREYNSFLPTIFWAEAVNTTCYVLNRVLVTKPQNKTPYELLTGRQPVISYLKPFGCHVTILNTIDQLGKFDGKSDLGFLVGYSLNSKAFRVYNLETKRVEENLHVNFLENTPNITGKGHAWMFDLDYLTNSMNYKSISLENQANKFEGPKEANHSAGTKANDDQDANTEKIDLHDEHFILHVWSAYSTSIKSSGTKIHKTTDCKTTRKEATHENQDANTNNTNLLNAVSAPVSVAGPSRALNDDEPSYPDDPSMPYLEDIYASPSARIFTNSSYDDEDLPFGKKAIGTKWVYGNKKDERGVVVRNKARLVAQGHKQEERIDYDEVFAPVAKIESIRIFLAFASYMGFIVYQMDVKSAFLYDTIDEEVYVTQPPGFVDPKFPNKVYKVVKALYGLHQAPRAWYATLSTFLERSGYRKGAIDKTLFIKQDKKDIMLEIHNRRLSISWQETYFMAMQKANYCGYFYYKGRICCCCGQVLWIHNQLLDYGFNLMNAKIYIDNESTICIVKNPVFHSKTKHIEIRHHFIRDAYEKKLIQVV